MSAFLESTSEILGEYMLKGWTLTDLVCSNCHTTPLMREPVGQARDAGRGESQRIEFCGRCQGGPGRAVRTLGASVDSDMSSFIPEVPSSSSHAILTSSHLPNGTSSYDTLLPPQPTSQSDRASSLIGNLLLRGYSLLAENCTNSTCRGIPLVGHPRKRGETHSEKTECVICGSVYDVGGELVSRPTEAANGSGHVNSPATAGDATSNEARRRALYEEGQRINAGVTSGEQNGGPSRLVNGTSASPEVTPSGQQDTDMEIDAMLAEENSAFGVGTTAEKVLTAINHSESILSTVLTSLSTSLSSRLSPPGASQIHIETRHDIKLHLERMSEVMGLLERAAAVRKSYEAKRGL